MTETGEFVVGEYVAFEVGDLVIGKGECVGEKVATRTDGFDASYVQEVVGETYVIEIHVSV
jgi:hypothetical protein